MKITIPDTISGGGYYYSHQVHSTTNKPWTKEDNKKFEDALATFDEKTPDRWFKVAEMIPGKSVQDVINQYRVLVADVSDIEAGLVPVPGYSFSSSSSSSSSPFIYELNDDHHQAFDAYRKRCKSFDHERRKGVPWTAEEHRLFLLGLMKHGKGDWRNISRNFVVSKTPTQVASHAQKYYQRQLSSGKDKRRPSIHDMTTFDLTSSSSSPTYNSNMNDPEKSNDGKNPMMYSKMVLGLNPYNSSTTSPLKVFGSDFLIPYPHDVMTGFAANPIINI